MLATLLTVSDSAQVPTSAPRRSNWAMCERSNKPARLRTASCSLRIPPYCTGISNPPNGTIRAPSARWVSCRAVRRRAPEASTVIPSGALSRPVRPSLMDCRSGRRRQSVRNLDEGPVPARAISVEFRNLREIAMRERVDPGAGSGGRFADVAAAEALNQEVREHTLDPGRATAAEVVLAGLLPEPACGKHDDVSRPNGARKA